MDDRCASAIVRAMETGGTNSEVAAECSALDIQPADVYPLRPKLTYSLHAASSRMCLTFTNPSLDECRCAVLCVLIAVCVNGLYHTKWVITSLLPCLPNASVFYHATHRWSIRSQVTRIKEELLSISMTTSAQSWVLRCQEVSHDCCSITFVHHIFA